MWKVSFSSLAAYWPDPNAPEVIRNSGDRFFFAHDCDGYKLSVVDPKQLRRMSRLTRMSVDLAFKAVGSEPVDHIVMATRHGELSTSVQLLEMIAKAEILSPTLFSYSVHNTSLGVYGILSQNQAATTAIGGGRDGFHMGLISALSFLSAHPQSRVLFICADEMVPEVFTSHLEEENAIYAGAFVLSNLGVNFEFSRSDSRYKHPNTQPQGLTFLKWLKSDDSSLDIQGETGTWGWVKLRC